MHITLNEGEAYRVEIRKPTKATVVRAPGKPMEPITLRKGERLHGTYTGHVYDRARDYEAIAMRCAEYNYAEVRIEIIPSGHIIVYSGCGVKAEVGRY